MKTIGNLRLHIYSQRKLNTDKMVCCFVEWLCIMDWLCGNNLPPSGQIELRSQAAQDSMAALHRCVSNRSDEAPIESSPLIFLHKATALQTETIRWALGSQTNATPLNVYRLKNRGLSVDIDLNVVGAKYESGIVNDR